MKLQRASQNKLKPYSYEHPVRNNHPLNFFLKNTFFPGFLENCKFSPINFTFFKIWKKIPHIWKSNFKLTTLLEVADRQNWFFVLLVLRKVALIKCRKKKIRVMRSYQFQEGTLMVLCPLTIKWGYFYLLVKLAKNTFCLVNIFQFQKYHVFAFINGRNMCNRKQNSG